ncbi:hypothetical protein H0W26_06280 [Candidatus Dependentiae bacterium]|nr:hypothetical protein [Candidatus Dependentiae bacterium]
MNYKHVGLGVMSILVVLCSAESFIVEEKQKRTRPDHQVKQEILDLMGRMAELESESIKTKAEIQQAFCRKIRGYIGGDKESFFASASRRDLQRVLTLLRTEASSLDKTIEADKRFLASLSTPLIA